MTGKKWKRWRGGLSLNKAYGGGTFPETPLFGGGGHFFILPNAKKGRREASQKKKGP